MNAFVTHVMSRLPRSWAARVVWLMLATAAFWVAYRFGSAYMSCRATGGKAGCFVIAFYATVINVFAHIVGTVIKLATLMLP
jgi:hypothetical protein